MASVTQRSMGQKLYYSEKEIEKASDTGIRRGQIVLQDLAGDLYSFAKECLKVVKVLPDPLPKLTY